MGDRHGGCFARRGRALSPPHRGFPMARSGFPMARGGVQDLPRAETLPTAKASRHGARAKGFAPRRNALLGEGLPTRRTGERICPARERSPRRRPPDTAHERKGLPPRENAPHGEACPTRRTGERNCPRRNAPHGESFPTRRTGERVCPAREYSPRRRPPDTAHERKDLPRAGTPPTAKASRHGARAKEFAPRRNALLGEGIPTRCTGERICPAREGSPRRRPPDTAHERKDLPRARTLSSAKASRHGARAKGFAPRGSPSPHVPTNGGPLSTDGQPKNTPSAGSHPQRAAAAEFIHRKK